MYIRQNQTDQRKYQLYRFTETQLKHSTPMDFGLWPECPWILMNSQGSRDKNLKNPPIYLTEIMDQSAFRINFIQLEDPNRDN